MIASMTFYVTIFNVAEPTLNCSQKVNNIEAQNSSKLRLETCDMWNNYSADKEASRYTCEFETIYYEKTIINEWGLICDKTHLAAITQTIFLIGNISAFLSGIVSDKFGRKKASIIFLGLFAFFSVIFNILMENYELIALSIWNRYIIYNIFQLISGILSCCLQVSIYVHLIELTTDEYHILVSNVTSYLYIIGEIFVLVVYYFTRSWIATNWFITIFAVVTLVPFCIFTPESPRWLAELDRFDEAYEILSKIAKINNRKNLIDRSSSINLMQGQQNELKLQMKINAIKDNNKKKIVVLPNFRFFKCTWRELQLLEVAGHVCGLQFNNIGLCGSHRGNYVTARHQSLYNIFFFIIV